MSDFSFHQFVWAEYGPFRFDEDMDDFIAERQEELEEAYEQWQRDEDDVSSSEAGA